MQCLHPIPLKKPTGELYSVNCGKCVACLQNRRYDWVFRMKNELKRNDFAYFITLTYEDTTLPKIQGVPQLWKRDLQLFFKRLRKISDLKFRYYAVGEYGSQTFRPHYHAILFVSGDGRSYERDYISRVITLAWSYHGQQIGIIDVGTCTDASISYVAKYVTTKQDVNDWINPPFALMSRKPAIGENYLSPAVKHYHKETKNFFAISDGRKIRLPRYYKDRIFDSRDLSQQNLKTKKLLTEAENKEIQRLKTDAFDYALQKELQKPLVEKVLKKRITKNKNL